MKRYAPVLLILLYLVTSTSCYYYKAKTYDNPGKKQIKFYRGIRESLNMDKYAIIHQGDKLWHVTNMETIVPKKKQRSPEFKVLFGSLEPVDSISEDYYERYEAADKRALRYKIRDEEYVIYQTHVFLNENVILYPDSFAIAISDIKRIENFQQATGRTSLTWTPFYLLIDILLSANTGHSGKSHHSGGGATNRQHAPRTR
jgi:hypothetical protein